MDTSAIQSGLTTAKTGVMALIKFIVDNVTIPIIDAVLLGFFVYYLATALQKHHQGEDYSKNMFLMGGLIIVIAIISTFPAWGWKMIGA